MPCRQSRPNSSIFDVHNHATSSSRSHMHCDLLDGYSSAGVLLTLISSTVVHPSPMTNGRAFDTESSVKPMHMPRYLVPVGSAKKGQACLSLGSSTPWWASDVGSLQFGFHLRPCACACEHPPLFALSSSLVLLGHPSVSLA